MTCSRGCWTAPGNAMPGKLVLVATPIGNLEDLSPRASRIIMEADIVMAEDTRHTAKLSGGGGSRLFSYHDHNATGRLPQIADFLAKGLTVAMVSDAGMPGISDPAFRAVRLAIEGGYRVEAVPGPSAVITALAASGLPVARFAFEGFLPLKKGARRRRIEEMAGYTGTLILFTGPHHLLRDLAELRDVLGDRPACVAREMTKLFEEYARGTLSELTAKFAAIPIRGEITLVVEGARGPRVDEPV